MTLMERHWRITDADGRQQEVRGPGVVGEQPTIKPGELYRYASGCPLATPSGMMFGEYRMVGEDGRSFDVAIPAFSLTPRTAAGRSIDAGPGAAAHALLKYRIGASKKRRGPC